ncbi:hypothetical protein BDZ45DRAFT_745114 [Acephala macrosclerotiorum]|nr:hypothetical protein BDZ45DRAFT_745114 [Acephala macrosclerotiorum]
MSAMTSIEEVVKTAAGNRSSGKEVMALLLNQRGDGIVATPQLVQALAKFNHGYLIINREISRCPSTSSFKLQYKIDTGTMSFASEMYGHRSSMMFWGVVRSREREVRAMALKMRYYSANMIKRLILSVILLLHFRSNPITPELIAAHPSSIYLHSTLSNGELALDAGFNIR